MKWQTEGKEGLWKALQCSIDWQDKERKWLIWLYASPFEVIQRISALFTWHWTRMSKGVGGQCALKGGGMVRAEWTTYLTLPKQCCSYMTNVKLMTQTRWEKNPYITASIHNNQQHFSLSLNPSVINALLQEQPGKESHFFYKWILRKVLIIKIGPSPIIFNVALVLNQCVKTVDWGPSCAINYCAHYLQRNVIKVTTTTVIDVRP